MADKISQIELFPLEEKVKCSFLSDSPPLIWPEPRWHSKHNDYEITPPFTKILKDADLISGVLVGVSEGSIKLLNNCLRGDSECKIKLIIIVYQAGPTREDHLEYLKNLQDQTVEKKRNLEIRLFPMARLYGQDCERIIFPPSSLQFNDSKSGRTWLSIGSVNDFGFDTICLGSLNLIFQPADGLRDNWRRWLQYLFSCSAPLNSDTYKIPHLVPAEGDPAAAKMWSEFEAICLLSQLDPNDRPQVDPNTGEVIANPDGSKIEPWDNGTTALDPLALKFQEIYSDGWLVTIDETTRIKPLAIPVKATLLGQQSERTVGSLTQKQSFNLKVLDEVVAKEIEKCRLVNDIMDLLSYSLSKGNRWLPGPAKTLLDIELEARNSKGCDRLKEALGGNTISEFIKTREESIRNDLDKMYNQLQQGKSVPKDKLKDVLDDVKNRLDLALNSRITPRAIYNRIAPPDLTASAAAENWNQPFSLLLRSARLIRKSFTDNYFPRRFSGLSITEDEFRNAMNVFEDSIVKAPNLQKALEELADLEIIENSTESPKEKCNAVWRIIKGPISF